MAYLYETATWRAIVRATRDPKLMAVFVASTTGCAYLLAKGSQVITQPASEQTKKEMERAMKKDYEAARYARHSKRALGVMIDSIKNDGLVDEAKDPSKPQIKLPGVMWHPKVARQDRERKLAAEREFQARVSASASPSGTQAASDSRNASDR